MIFLNIKTIRGSYSYQHKKELLEKSGSNYFRACDGVCAITSPQNAFLIHFGKCWFSDAISESHSGWYFAIIVPLVPGPQLIVAWTTSYVCPVGNYSGYCSVNKWSIVFTMGLEYNICPGSKSCWVQNMNWHWHFLHHLRQCTLGLDGSASLFLRLSPPKTSFPGRRLQVPTSTVGL